MSLRILRRLLQQQCQPTNQHVALIHGLHHNICLSSSFKQSSGDNLFHQQSYHGVEVNLEGAHRHYCSGQTRDLHPSGDIQQLLEESSDPHVTDGEDLVYWDQPQHRTNPLYKSVEQQAEEESQKKPDPRFASIMLFPGSLKRTKGLFNPKPLPIVQQMYSTASDILGFDLMEKILRGSREELLNIQIQDPAVLVASLAAIERLREERPGALELCSSTAGYGVGEITALTFAGALSFEDAVHVVKVRAEAMQLSAEMTSSGAVRVHSLAACRLSLVCNAALEHCKRMGVENPHCSVAAYLYPSCKVVAGSNEALSFLEEHSTKLQLKRVKRLPHIGAFHTELMKPAADVLAQALQTLPMKKPIVRVLATADNKIYESPDDIQRGLPRQVRRPLQWQQTLARLYDRPEGQRFPTTYECGPSDGLLAKILSINNEKAAANMHVITA